MPDVTAVRAARLPRDVLRSLLARQAMPIFLIGLVVWLLRDRVAGIRFGDILNATLSIPPLAWAVAGAATLVSFWAIGRYDAVIHRMLATGVTSAEARLSGIVGIATSQTAGFGLLTGTLARWRMLPDQSLWQAARITMTVTVSFMAGLAVIGAIAALLQGLGGPVARGGCLAVLAGALIFASLSIWRPRQLVHLTFPSLRAQGAIVGLVALDTVAAAVALYVLLPVSAMPPVPVFYAAFVLALGAGLIAATPGGIGPFEVVCLACLPSVPEANLLAAIAAYRLVYHGLPGAAAAVALFVGAPGPRRDDATQDVDLLPAGWGATPIVRLDDVLWHAPRAEAQLLRQGELDLLVKDQTPLALAKATGQSLLVLGDPLSKAVSPGTVIACATKAAKMRQIAPCLYKCSGRVALAARRAGWRCVRVSHEAWIAPATHDLAGPRCRQLRRQLRKAEGAGLRAVEAGAVLPLDRMTDIAADWAKRRGGSRGFSLGRYDPLLLHRQRVFLCFDTERRLVAFATFHQVRAEWTLDQMCQRGNAPPGAMQMLIVAAIAAARRQGCPRVSLAAVPRTAPRWLPLWLARRINALSGAAGLGRFKSAFDPNWEPLYMAAPSRLALVLGAVDLFDRITRPERRNAHRSLSADS